MCLIVVAWRLRQDYPLLLAANRDEYFARPTTPADFWADHSDILAGRDLLQGGTWLGLTRSGRLAAVTNFRDGRRTAGQRSRGWLVRDYLLSGARASAFLAQLRAEADTYDGFNLIAGTVGGLLHYSNRGGEVTPLAPGVHGLSNHLLNTPWPKVERARQDLARLAVSTPAALAEHMFALLADQTVPPDEALPDTGVGLEVERLLSTALIRSEGYGTRCSTVLIVDHAGRARFEERTLDPDGSIIAERKYELQLDDAPGAATR